MNLLLATGFLFGLIIASSSAGVVQLDNTNVECSSGPPKLIKSKDANDCLAKCKKDSNCKYVVFGKTLPSTQANCGFVPKTGCNPVYSSTGGQWKVLADLQTKSFTNLPKTRLGDSFNLKSVSSDRIVIVDPANGSEDCKNFCLLTNGCNAFVYEGQGHFGCTLKQVKGKANKGDCSARAMTLVMDPSMVVQCKQ